jgi:hypothetical protein
LSHITPAGGLGIVGTDLAPSYAICTTFLTIYDLKRIQKPSISIQNCFPAIDRDIFFNDKTEASDALAHLNNYLPEALLDAGIIKPYHCGMLWNVEKIPSGNI